MVYNIGVFITGHLARCEEKSFLLTSLCPSVLLCATLCQFLLFSYNIPSERRQRYGCELKMLQSKRNSDDCYT
jgi:hypothetical protein